MCDFEQVVLFESVFYLQNWDRHIIFTGPLEALETTYMKNLAQSQLQ